ncbi:MAG: peptide chain release factor 2 [Buchnera aphidicola (Floraphis choui)]
MVCEISVIKRRIQMYVNKINNLKELLDYNNKKDRLLEINSLLELSKVWQDPSLIINLSREKSILVSSISSISEIESNLHAVIDILKLSINENNLNLLCDVISELNVLDNAISVLELNSIFSKKDDHFNCYLDIQSGSGGTESQDWANMLLRMYLKWAEYKKFNTEIVDRTYGEIVGIKSATVKIQGPFSFGWFRTETGIHRLVRKSPFNSNNQRHTSFSSIFVYPDIDDSINIKINFCDLRIDVYRASGAGGQHINKTESAVRITHVPSGIVTQSQSSRSQHKNKDQAFKQLKAKLYEVTMSKKNNEKKILESKKSDIGWGNQIRSYILDDSRVKDLRTGIEVHDVQSVLDGDLDLFVESSLKRGL